MRLGYFTMPLHPLHRNPTETLQEDREAIILADKLGFYDAFVGEHLTDQAENVTNSLLFLATLIPVTSRIKLASGTSNLSHSHPTLLAAHAAMFDHLAKGRFIFGISPGALASDAEALGILDQDRNRLFAEAIDVILAIWEKNAPYDIDLPDNRFKVTTAGTCAFEIGRGIMPKPYQRPYPEIVGTVVAPFSKGVVAMGRRDALRIYVGKAKGMHAASQDEINAILVREARDGRRVVRLKSGDPLIFGRAGEEMAALRAAGIPFDIVPGVTAAIAAAAENEIPLTLRDVASTFILATGHDMRGDTLPEWAGLALAGSTIAVYMGRSVASKVAARLIENGLSASTPVAVIENASREDRRAFAGRLDELAGIADRPELDGPVVIIVGKVIAESALGVAPLPLAAMAA